MSKPVAYIVREALTELQKHKDASATVWSGLNTSHPFVGEAVPLYASPVEQTPAPESHVGGSGDAD